MAKAFDRDELLAAFDAIGTVAHENGVVLHIAVYGGSALMLASNFRFSSEDVDIAELPKPWPAWLKDIAAKIAVEHGWAADWLNEAVDVHLSSLATRDNDHLEFGTFPRSNAEAGLVVYVPSVDYMLALKLKAIRMLDPLKGRQEAADIRNLMRAAAIEKADDAISVLGRFFPLTAGDPAKQLFLLKHLLVDIETPDAPRYPV